MSVTQEVQEETLTAKLSVRLSSDQRRKADELTTQANFETVGHLLRALLGQLAEITNGEPFDVRDLVLKGGE